MTRARLLAALLAGTLAASGLVACTDRNNESRSNDGDVPSGTGNTVETNPTTLQATTKTEEQVTQPQRGVTAP